jgi:tRNA dimethylallyltransferase
MTGRSPTPNLIVICGPTASGKTALAVSVARALGGEVISADSRQVYRGLDIGSGKDLGEYSAGGATVPYHLIDIADPRTVYTLFHFQHDFYRVYGDITSRGRIAVLCGGTGLYIEAVLRGYEVPAIPENPALRQQLMKLDHADLERMLAELDNDIFNRTDRSSKKRVVRAIEVAMSREAIPAGDDRAAASGVALYPLILCTRWERSTLHDRIDRRLDERIAGGLIDEVRRLRSEGVPDDRLMMLGMEYKYLTLFLRGELDKPTMTEQLRRAIHQLAKRQETYFRGMERRGSALTWIDNADSSAAFAAIAASGML